MDEDLRMVRSLLDKPAPTADAVTAGRERLRDGARTRARTRPGRTMWLTGGLGLTAAAAAAAVAISTTGGSAGGPAGDRPGGTGSPPRTVALNAHTVLLAAASRADVQPDRVGKYWHSVTLGRSYFRVAAPTGDYTVLSEGRSEQWTPSAVRQDQVASEQRLGARPATAADVAAWKKAGSPTSFTFSATPYGKGKGKMVMPAQPGKVSVSRAPLVDGDKVFWLGRNVTMKDLRALPADPKRLKASLSRWYQGHGTESSSEAMGSDLWLYTVAKGLIMDMPVTPKVRGAAFRMLADLKMVKAIGAVKDAQGRTGTAIAVTEPTKGNGTLQHRLIIDTATGRALAEELIVLKPAGSTAGLAPGSLYSSSAVLTQDWTDATPPGSRGAQRGD
ncbi:CU044_5270 family protein [Actinoallomurus sp. CA-150999]|uniref:CU044_5270 family protein n=1 Tax=Actinoallomurus sp. CA-150999 TaxID=3239887 RepID=UPI003D9152E0